MAIGLPTTLRNSRLQIIADAIDDGADEYTIALLQIYSGERPSPGGEPDEYDNILLAEFNLPGPCGSVTDGVLEFDTIEDTVGLEDGVATWARIISPMEDFVMDLSVGDDIQMDTTTIATGVGVSCSLATITEGNE